MVRKKAGLFLIIGLLSVCSLAMAACAQTEEDEETTDTTTYKSYLADQMQQQDLPEGDMPNDISNGNPANIPPEGDMMPMGEADHGSYACYLMTDADGQIYESIGYAENAVRIDGVEVALKGVTLIKTTGATTSTDNSSLYGVNAALLAVKGAQADIENSSVDTTADGSAGIFCYGESTSLSVIGTTIRTAGTYSSGIAAAEGGTVHINNCDIETMGTSSAALKAGKNGGELVVTDGRYATQGGQSPALSCMSSVSIADAVLTAGMSEAVKVDGSSSVKLTNCDVTGNMTNDSAQSLYNVLVYQSSLQSDMPEGGPFAMEADGLDEQNAVEARSSFTMNGGSLSAQSGDMIYVTNTSCDVTLNNVELNLFNDVLLKVAGNDGRNGWGTSGSNGGNCVFIAEKQSLYGNVIVDGISTLNMQLKSGTDYTGAVNTDNTGADIVFQLDADCTWTLTADSYVTSLSGVLKNIDTNGFTLYVNGAAFSE